MKLRSSEARLQSVVHLRTGHEAEAAGRDVGAARGPREADGRFDVELEGSMDDSWMNNGLIMDE